MKDINTRLQEFVKYLRSQAEEYGKTACDSSLGNNFEIKMVSTMYAYKEIADEIEKEFLLWNGEL